MSAIIDEPVLDGTDNSEFEETHIYCEVCYPAGEIAMCGTDVSDHPFSQDAEATCAVCAYMEELPCPTCGE